MPQKKNPDACELLRGKSARLQGNLHTLLALVKGLPMTYNRDLQEDKPPVFDSFDQSALCADVLAGQPWAAWVQPALRRRLADPALLATDLADYLVERGVPFREAHHAVGAVVALAERKGCLRSPELSTEEVKRLHAAFGQDWRKVFDLAWRLRGAGGPGCPAPRSWPASSPAGRRSFGSLRPRAGRSHRNGQGSHPLRPRGQPDRRREVIERPSAVVKELRRERPRRGRHPRLGGVRPRGPLPDPGRGQRARDVPRGRTDLAPSPCHEQDRRRRGPRPSQHVWIPGRGAPLDRKRFALRALHPGVGERLGHRDRRPCGTDRARAVLREAGRHTHRRGAPV
jgi:hypothetical protein